MHNAPVVTFPVSNDRMGVIVVAAVWCVAVGVVGAWLLQAVVDNVGLAALAATTLLAAVSIMVAGQPVGPGVLRWDGKDWHWQPDDNATVGRLIPMLDLQVWILLRFVPASGRAFWLWASRGDTALQWDAFRRAVVDAAKRA